MVALVVPFLIYELILFVACYIIVEYGQKYLYDEAPPSQGLRVALGSLILAALLTKTRSNFATMFTDDIAWTVLQAIVWSGVFILVFRFQPWHGLGFGVATMLVLVGLSTIAVDSLTVRTRSGDRIDTSVPVRPPPRRPSYSAPKPVAPDPKP